MNKKSTAKTVGLVMVIMMCGKIAGLVRDILLNAKMGTETIERTALEPALSIPSQFLDFAFAAALSSSFIPVFNEFLAKKTRKEAFELANRFITLTLVLTAAVVIGAEFAADGLIGFFVPGIVDAETKLLAVRLLKIMLPAIALTAAAFSMTGVLQSLGEFNIPAAMSVVSNLIVIFYFLFLYDKYGVTGVAVSFLIGWSTQVLVQVPSLYRRGYVFRPDFMFHGQGMKEIGVLTVPVLVSTWVAPVNNMVNRNIASQLDESTFMNALSTANTLFSVITGVFILSVANVIFPKLSNQNAGGDRDGFAATINASLRVCAFLLVPMSVGLCLLSVPVIRLVFERGMFTDISTERSAAALACYSVGMAGLGLQTILSRGFYAKKDAKTPFITSIIAIALNAALSPVLADYMGVGGPALASGIAITAAGVVMLLVMRNGDKRVFDTGSLAAVGKVLASAAIMGVSVFFAVQFMDKLGVGGVGKKLADVLFPVGIGVAVYLTAAVLLKIEEASIFFEQVRIFCGKFMGRLGRSDGRK